MQPNWAEENLQVIRTLMERAALYRRALAPAMLSTGAVGVVAAIIGWSVEITTPRLVTAFWMATAVCAIGVAFACIRQQAIRAREPLLSAPTQRIMQAMLPAIFSGMMAGILLGLPEGSGHIPTWWLPSIWMGTYGCAVHSAGFFMPRGIKLFGWVMILSAVSMFYYMTKQPDVPPMRNFHVVMGIGFGATHLAYGIYLYFTEKSRNAQ
ncbi:MAG: hypothetical protein HY300_11825 [Verrucomicrobia bacterium]|nr:hypothetical protein [Verrucomicrobiota bacterium]